MRGLVCKVIVYIMRTFLLMTFGHTTVQSTSTMNEFAIAKCILAPSCVFPMGV